MAIKAYKPNEISPLVRFGLDKLLPGSGSLIKSSEPVEQVGAADSAIPAVEDNFKMPQLGDSAGYNPMEAKMQSMQKDPMGMTNEALALLKDPSIPQDIRDQYAAPLLKYKYYGNKGIA